MGSSDRVSGKEASALLALKEDHASRRTYPIRRVRRFFLLESLGDTHTLGG